MFSKASIKCKQCRRNVFNSTVEYGKPMLLNAHGEIFNSEIKVNEDSCPSIKDEKMLFLNEDNLPQWILSEIKTCNWSKGKINCPCCKSKIGSFDFISGLKCECSQSVLPAVHIIKSKVDFVKI